ncbi:MAG: hypothetical protein QM734_05955 [Cyclobacteriaceae bacterium]
MFKLLTRIVSWVSFEFFLTKFNWPNGGTIIFLRTLFISLLIFTVYVSLRIWLDNFKLDGHQLEVCGAVFAAIYLALYSRFAAQWTYLANLYNQIKQAESAKENNQEIISQWKAGFIEDAIALHLAKKPMFAMTINSWGKDEKVKACFESDVHDGKKIYEKLMEEIKDVLQLKQGNKNTKSKLVRPLVILISLIAYFLCFNLILEQLDLYYFDSTVIWNISVIQFYILLSISLFIILNLTLKIESLIKRNDIHLLQRNLSGLYGYLGGTGIYIGINLFYSDPPHRVLCLLIPFCATLLGFITTGKDVPKKILNKKLLLTVNLIILFYWSVIILVVHKQLEARRKLFGDELKYFEKSRKKILR